MFSLTFYNKKIPFFKGIFYIELILLWIICIKYV